MNEESFESRIPCPNCGVQIDVNDVLAHQLEDKIRKQFADQLQQLHDDARKKQQSMESAFQEFEREKQEIMAQSKLTLEKELSKKQQEISQQLREKIEQEQSSRIEEMNKELNEKNAQLKQFNQAKTEIEKLKREKDLMRDEIIAESEKKLSAELIREKEKIQRAFAESSQLALAEREKVISDLSQQLKDAQRRAEQGSTQLQGEMQELAIEQWLGQQFPLDTIEEVKKGANGADCIQIINTREAKSCGTIYYESKRTKTFSPAWIAKFKQDMIDRGVEVGVLVTQTMPADMQRMGMREGIWICTLEEFKGLAAVLRDAAIRVSNISASSENKGDKMEMLYDYLSGNEFRQQVEAIVEGFTQMQTDLESEKRSMQQIWKKREKQIEKVLLNTNHMYGSVKGIAGNAIQSVALLELDETNTD